MRSHKHKAFLFLSAFTLICAVAFSTPGPLSASQKEKQKTFASPEKAEELFIAAMKAGDRKELSVIFGPETVSQLSSGDDVSDRAEREWFLKAYEEKHSLEKKADDKVLLQVGKDDWPFPIPLVKKGQAWFFDSEEGREEILNRRIGRNELRVIETMKAYVVAQREYARKDRHGDGVHPYAQKFVSTPGRKDGLYWEAKKGEEESPFGPLAAKAAQEGYTGETKSNRPSPFHGYYFRILTAQGKHAPGGAYDYKVKGKMILGFGLVAYPAKYGSSGIMTFLVNQQGIVYEKDLGRSASKTAKAMKKYDPDKTWKKVVQTSGN